ncbi:MAG: cytochrome C [Armatimonadetes bacterium]|nr:cytochrome C [Armatimonadota bacterium]
MRVRLRPVLFAGMLLSALLITTAHLLAGGGRGPSLPKSGVQRGLAISPVPLDLRGKNRSLVAQGSYIVNAQGGCNGCHTNPPFAPGGDPYQGQPEQINTAHFLAGGQQFGPITSANITPDEMGRPAMMTLDEFMMTMRTGREHDDPDEILQVMPWPYLAKMTDRDLHAVYEYLRAIPHAEPGP